MMRPTYLVETPCPIANVSAMMAGEQNVGTVLRVKGETDDLPTCFGGTVLVTEEVGRSESPLPRSAWAERTA